MAFGEISLWRLAKLHYSDFRYIIMKLYLFYFNISKVAFAARPRFRRKVRGDRLKAGASIANALDMGDRLLAID